jgi:hypothetical protein
VPNDERSEMNTQDEQRAYYALCNEAQRLGLPTALDDFRSPSTTAGLRLAVELVRDAGHSVEGALNAAQAYEARYA